MTAVGNERSRRVMARVGMTRNVTDDFDHPNIVAGHPLRRQVVYRLTVGDWAVSLTVTGAPPLSPQSIATSHLLIQCSRAKRVTVLLLDGGQHCPAALL